MLNASQLQDNKTSSFYKSRYCQYIAMATILREIRAETNNHTQAQRKLMFAHLLRINHLNYFLVCLLSYCLKLYTKAFFPRVVRKMARILGLQSFVKIQTFYATDSQLQDMLEASKKVEKLTQGLLAKNTFKH